MGTGVSQCGADDLGKLRRGSQIGSGSVTEATRGLHCASGAGIPVPPALGAPSRGPSAASFVRALPPSRQPGGSPASLAPPPPAGGSFVAVESALSGPFLFAASGAACCRRPWSSREKVLSVNTKPRRRTAHSPPHPGTEEQRTRNLPRPVWLFTHIHAYDGFRGERPRCPGPAPGLPVSRKLSLCGPQDRCVSETPPSALIPACPPLPPGETLI